MNYYLNKEINNLEGEYWKSFNRYKGCYEVSNLGRIKSLPRKGRPYTEKILSQNFNKDKYLTVHLCKNGIAKRLMVHQIVCMAFHKNPKNKPESNHKNGIKTDNRSVNVEWATSSENQIHAFKTGLQVSKKGIDHPQARLSEENILDIRNSNKPRKTLAEIYKINLRTVFYIRSGKYWKHLPLLQTNVTEPSAT